jgi:FLYWCH zinc finger domain
MSTDYLLHNHNVYFSQDGRFWQCAHQKDYLCEAKLLTDGTKTVRKVAGVHNHPPPSRQGSALQHENNPAAAPDDDDDMTQDDDASSVEDSAEEESLQTLVTARDVWLPTLTSALDDIIQRRHPEASSDTKQGGFLLPLLGALGALGALASGTKHKRKT